MCCITYVDTWRYPATLLEGSEPHWQQAHCNPCRKLCARGGGGGRTVFIREEGSLSMQGGISDLNGNASVHFFNTSIPNVFPGICNEHRCQQQRIHLSMVFSHTFQHTTSGKNSLPEQNSLVKNLGELRSTTTKALQAGPSPVFFGGNYRSDGKVGTES